MDYYLTNHANDALVKRKIPLVWLERTLFAPEWTEKDRIDNELEHRLARIPEFGGRVLRIIVNPTVKPLRIISVYFDRRRKNDEVESGS